ncbi:MAG: MazG-like family protein [Anaerolineae bacterium]|nr:MazG-like family protein [Anaerolineae bacterium]
MIDKLYKIAQALNNKFRDGSDDPFKIVTRLAEECGEVATEVNHLEGMGVKLAKLGAPDRNKLAKELAHVMGVVLQLAIHYRLQDEMAAYVDQAYQRVVSEGWVGPLARDAIEAEGGQPA